ncbi:MAG: hypothetical protein M3P33_02960 [bacterium]|nr:hypothetical protein [bacterium]
MQTQFPRILLVALKRMMLLSALIHIISIIISIIITRNDFRQLSIFRILGIDYFFPPQTFENYTSDISSILIYVLMYSAMLFYSFKKNQTNHTV